MASFSYSFFFSINVILFFYSFTANASTRSIKPNSFLLPVKKDTKTHQYYTSLGVGNPSYPVDLVISIESELVWFYCDKGFTSSSYKPIPCQESSEICPKTSDCHTCTDAKGFMGCSKSKQVCLLSPIDPITSAFVASSGLYEDTLHLASTNVTNFLFSCVRDMKRDSFLPSNVEGILGLLRSSIYPIQKRENFWTMNRKNRAFCRAVGSSKFTKRPLFNLLFSYLHHLSSELLVKSNRVNIHLFLLSNKY